MKASSNKLLLQLASVSAFLLTAYSLLTIVIMTTLGSPSESMEQIFDMLNQNRFLGALRLDIATVFAMPLYYILFYGIYLELKQTHKTIASISTVLIITGVTLFLAAPSVFSYLYLSDRYVLAGTENEKAQLIAAGYATLASDMWHGTGARIGGMLMQSGAFVISLLMLKKSPFNKLTAYSGIFTHGLDLVHVIIGFFNIQAGNILMILAGPLYLLWFPLIGIQLWRNGNSSPSPTKSNN